MKKHTIALTVILAGCGGGSTATLSLMDAPPDGVTAVNITVHTMQVHVADAGNAGSADDSKDDSGWQTLTVDRTIDLVAHQGETAADVLGQLDLPAGKITQIRLQLDTSSPDKNTATVNGTTCNLDVSRVDLKGVKIIHPFKAFDSRHGSHVELVVDFRLDESLTPSGACFQLEPRILLHRVRMDGKDVDF